MRRPARRSSATTTASSCRSTSSRPRSDGLTAGGRGTARTLDVVIVRVADLAFLPLSVAHRLVPGVAADYPEIGVTSVAVGAAAVGAWSLARRGWRRRDHTR